MEKLLPIHLCIGNVDYVSSCWNTQVLWKCARYMFTWHAWRLLLEICCQGNGTFFWTNNVRTRRFLPCFVDVLYSSGCCVTRDVGTPTGNAHKVGLSKINPDWRRALTSEAKCKQGVGRGWPKATQNGVVTSTVVVVVDVACFRGPPCANWVRRGGSLRWYWSRRRAPVPAPTANRRRPSRGQCTPRAPCVLLRDVLTPVADGAERVHFRPVAAPDSITRSLPQGLGSSSCRTSGKL